MSYNFNDQSPCYLHSYSRIAHCHNNSIILVWACLRLPLQFYKNCKSVSTKSKNCFEKKNVYSFVSMNLRIVLKILQKTDFFLKRQWTATDANTDQSDDRKKGKKRKKTTENKKNDMYYQNFWKENCFNDIMTIHMQIILIKSKI